MRLFEIRVKTLLTILTVWLTLVASSTKIFLFRVPSPHLSPYYPYPLHIYCLVLLSFWYLGKPEKPHYSDCIGINVKPMHAITSPSVAIIRAYTLQEDVGIVAVTEYPV